MTKLNKRYRGNEFKNKSFKTYAGYNYHLETSSCHQKLKAYWLSHTFEDFITAYAAEHSLFLKDVKKNKILDVKQWKTDMSFQQNI